MRDSFENSFEELFKGGGGGSDISTSDPSIISPVPSLPLPLPTLPTQETLLHQINHLIGPLLTVTTWSYIEMIGGLMLFCVCLYARVNDEKYMTSNNKGFFENKITQLGLFLQMIISVFIIVDSYQVDVRGYNPHVFLIILLLSTILIKADIISDMFKRLFTKQRKIILLTD